MGGRPFLILTAIVVTLTSKYSLVEGVCGYESCPEVKDGFLNVHLVPHSHDDVGWLKTVDQYYYGDKNHIQLAAVQYTLDSVVEQLQKSPDRRFIYVESGFFWRWWTNQDEETKNIVRKLVASGQLEFINGGWVMNDEAATHYNAIIDQMSFGLRFLNETFGECGLPRVAWQIDPFGHSREQASLFAQLGFDGLFFGRLDYQDKYYRRINQNMETMWNGSPKNLGKDASLFTGVLYNGYNPPDGYCFDILCEDEPINDDPKLFDYNLDTKVDNFIKISQEWGAPYKTENVLMTMGSDFQYMAAHMWYKNLDKLIKHVNARQVTNSSKVNLVYSTPSCYLQEVNRKLKTPLTVKTDDFFPYASDPHAFWTGYFTSRPTLKYYTHKTNNFLQACKQVALSGYKGKVPQDVLDKIWVLEEALAILQHHDAVSGTAKQHVTDDYSKRLAIGVQKCEEVIDMSLRKLIKSQPSSEESQESTEVPKRFGKSSSQTFEFCQELNISSCAASESKNDFVLSVYNPLAWDTTDVYIRIPVPSPSWSIRGPDGDISYQSTIIPKPVMNIPGRESAAQYEIVFKASKIPSLSLANFQLTRNEDSSGEQRISRELRQQLKPVKKGPDSSRDGRKGGDFWIENSKGLGILFDGLTGLMKRVKRGNSETKLSQNFFYYPGMSGNNSKFEFRASGAYIFRPNTTNSHDQPLPITERVFSYFVYKGEHVTEVHQVFTEWISQVIRLYDTADKIEFEWLVGPIPIYDDVGKEIVTRYSSDLETNGLFFTDSNGRELLKRKRDYRPTWRYKVYEKIAGNYYPVNSRMIISEDADLKETGAGKTITVLNDRAQGGSSMNDGEIELMVHRRLLDDDAFGVGEALNEMAYGTGLVASGKHWLVFSGGDTGVPVSSHRKLAQEIFMNKIYAFSDVQDGYSAYMRNSVMRSPDLTLKESIFSKLKEILPANIHLLTLEPISNGQFILRLEHFYENGEDPELSKKVVISMKSLKEALPFVKDLQETTLGANQWKKDAKRLQWTTVEDEASNSKILPSQSDSTNANDADDAIEFSPMQIRTYVVSVQ